MMIHSSIKLRMCKKIFLLDQLKYTKYVTTQIFNPNVLWKLCLLPCDCGFVKMNILEKQPTYLVLFWACICGTNAWYFNFLSFTVPESSTITVWWESDTTYNVVLLSPHAFQNLSNIRILYCSPSSHLG